MEKLLKWHLLSCLFLCLGVGLLLSVPAGAVDVSDPVLDIDTKGDWRGTYGDCYVQLPDAGCTGFPEPEFGTEFGGVCTSDPLPVVNDTFNTYRGDGRPANTFWNTVNDCPQDCIDNPNDPCPGLCGTVEEQFGSCGADFSMCDDSAQWNPCAGAFKGTLWDEGDCFTSGGVVPPLTAEFTIDFEGSTELAYYFAAGCGSSRTQNWWLYIDDVPEKTGTITVTGDGKYLKFQLDNVVAGTNVRFETQNLLPTQCNPTPSPPGGPPNNSVLSGVFLSDCVTESPKCSIGDFVFEDANRDGCQDPDERPIEGVEVKLFEGCADPAEVASATTNADGFYEFTGLDCSKEYRVQFGPAGDIYDYTIADQECVDGDPDESDKEDSDCSQGDGFSGCVTFPDPVNNPNDPTIDCGYVCEGKIGDYVWLDENEDGCQDEVNTGIAGVDVTLSEDCIDRENPQSVQTDLDGFYEFAGLCPGDYFVEFGNGRPNTNPGQVCDGDPDVSDEKDSNCGDEALQCVELTKDNPEDPTIDCGKVGPCIELEKLVSGDGGVNFFDADNCSDADVPFTADDAEYKLIVTNCGKEAVDLDRIVDLDLGINLVLDPVVTIPPGDTVTFTNDAGQTQGLLQKEDACPNPDDQFDNTATVFGMGAGSNQPVEATDPACVKCGPCIEILKDVRDAENQSGDYQPADSCDDTVPINNGAEYRLTVTNCGAEDLRDVKINDLKLNITEFPVGILAAGETKVFFFDRPDGGIPELQQPTLCEDISPQVEFLNVSRVEGTGVDSNLTVTDENPACVECQPEEELGCRLTGGLNSTFDTGNGVNRYTSGGQVGASTAAQPQPKGEWTHHQQRGPAGDFTFHGGTSSAPEGTEIDAIRCSDPNGCKPSGNPPSPVKQLDFDGIGTFKNIGKNGDKVPDFVTAGANVTAEGNGNKDFDGTFHWFEVNIDDLGEPGNTNPKKNPGDITPDLCPSIGFGEKGEPGTENSANCECSDFYRITIYDGVNAADIVKNPDGSIDPSQLNRTDVIYEVWGPIDGGNYQIHRPTGFDRKNQ